jgi:hypothetical protein
MRWYVAAIAIFVAAWFIIPNTVRPLVDKVRSKVGM